MLDNKQLKKKSKFLSLILRHKPELIGITLDKNGWVETQLLLNKINTEKYKMSFAELEDIVENNNKQRFAFNEDKSMIRANQGHSIDLNLGYDPIVPPKILYHGTATRFLDSIKNTGLEKRNRHHVHMSQDIDTAKNVGQRHGKVVILTIQSMQMHEAGFIFYQSENGVWLTDHVPIDYIDFPK